MVGQELRNIQKIAPKHWRHLWVRLARRPLRVVLGSAGIADEGWIATDQDRLDILVGDDWRRNFQLESVDAILAEHVWEHLTETQGLTAARHCYRYLKPGGYARVAVPDGLHPDPGYIEAVRPGGVGPGAEDHKVLFTYSTFRTLFEKAGFDVHVLEYFDEEGRFHAEDWDAAGGTIRRSRRFDPRNTEDCANYTSIILDAVKPS